MSVSVKVPLLNKPAELNDEDALSCSKKEQLETKHNTVVVEVSQPSSLRKYALILSLACVALYYYSGSPPSPTEAPLVNAPNQTRVDNAHPSDSSSSAIGQGIKSIASSIPTSAAKVSTDNVPPATTTLSTAGASLPSPSTQSDQTQIQTRYVEYRYPPPPYYGNELHQHSSSYDAYPAASPKWHRSPADDMPGHHKDRFSRNPNIDTQSPTSNIKNNNSSATTGESETAQGFGSQLFFGFLWLLTYPLKLLYALLYALLSGLVLRPLLSFGRSAKYVLYTIPYGILSVISPGISFFSVAAMIGILLGGSAGWMSEGLAQLICGMKEESPDRTAVGDEAERLYEDYDRQDDEVPVPPERFMTHANFYMDEGWGSSGESDDEKEFDDVQKRRLDPYDRVSPSEDETRHMHQHRRRQRSSSTKTKHRTTFAEQGRKAARQRISMQQTIMNVNRDYELAKATAATSSSYESAFAPVDPSYSLGTSYHSSHRHVSDHHQRHHSSRKRSSSRRRDKSTNSKARSEAGTISTVLSNINSSSIGRGVRGVTASIGSRIGKRKDAAEPYSVDISTRI